MHALVLTLFVTVFASEYLARQLAVVHRYFTLLPELLSAVAMLAIVALALSGRRWQLDWRYGLFIGLYLFVILFGFLAQAVPTGAVVAGLRSYIKFLPFFLLAALDPFSTRQLKIQVGLLGGILLLQAPLSVYQRFVQFAHQMHTGDPVRGMTTSSGVLSVLLVCAIAVVVTLYLRRHIRLPILLVAVAAFGLPTTLNETKSTLILLPLAVLGPLFFMPRGARVAARLVPLIAVGAAAAVAFVAVYDRQIEHRSDGSTILSFFTEGSAEKYLYTGAAEGEERWIGRFDSISLALQGVANDPFALAFGLGAGNVSESFLPGFEGRYASYFNRFGVNVTQVSTFIWEIGLVGLATVLLACWFVWRDARLLARGDGFEGALGQAWAVITMILVLALVYNAAFSINEIAYLFWFYSGVVAGSAHALRTAARRRKREPAPVWQAGAAFGTRALPRALVPDARQT